MKNHYTEADLLETYYTQPGESMPVMMHLASCSECAARYDRLDRKIREAAACHTNRDEGFWATQRAKVMSRVQGSGTRGRFAAPLRVAAAALLAVVIGGLVVYEPAKTPAVEPVRQTQQVEQTEERIPTDPWQSEELEEFGSVVQWETWIENGEQKL
jgi:anti-sigma factor RsiW